MSDNVLDIVVIGKRIYEAELWNTFASFFYQSWQNLQPSQRDQEWQFGIRSDHVEDYTSPNHLKKQVILNSIQDFITYMDGLKAQLAAIPAGTRVSIGGGYSMSIEQLRDKVGAMRFQVVDKMFRSGYGGANYGDRIEIDWRTLAGYVARGDLGLTYLVFHEIAHNTELGIASRSWNWSAHLNTGGTADTYVLGNARFERQEAQANTIARNIAQSIGLSLSSPAEPNFPPHGFTDLGM